MYSAPTVRWVASTGERVEFPSAYEVRRCTTCRHVLLYCGDNYINDLDGDDLVWPQSGQLDLPVPPIVKAAYAEAFRVKEVAPNAFANQIRRALEAVCRDCGARGKSLATMLKSLEGKSDLPADVLKIGEVVRLLGNVGSHSADSEVKPWEVWILDDLFRVVVEYVYVAPSKVRQLLARIQANSTQAKSGGE